MAFIRIPETQQHKKNDQKNKTAKRLCRLADTASIRSSGCWTNGTPATEYYKTWAQTVWPFPIEEEIVGAKGLLALCDGELA